MTRDEVLQLIADVQRHKSETGDVEVKTARGGTPKRAYEALSAFANHPGGGIMLFGLDENKDFEVVGVGDDVGDLIGVQARVDGVADRADARDAVVDLQMAVGVPGQRADPLAVAHAQPAQRVRELGRALAGSAIRRAVDRPLDAARDDLHVAVEAGRVLDDRAHQQWGLHHRAAHRLVYSVKGTGKRTYLPCSTWAP